MERETTTFSTNGIDYKIKTYVNAREQNIIQQAYFKGSKVELVGNEPKFSEFNPNVQYEVKLELIRQLVVEMDGSKESIVERCEDIPAEHFDILIDELDRLASKKKN